ncbi:MAG TPA: hypothetical protein VJ783_00370 [Pirellulales bacterium]|nr:hypothetical protein [Pirellulales bacterium]
MTLVPVPPAAEAADSACALGIEDAQFTINGRPTFLLGISYYGGLGAAKEQRRQDFDEMQQCGFNWVRVWATWAAFGGDLSAVDPTTGEPREPFFSTLAELVAECDRRGMAVDVTLSRGKSTVGPPRLPTHEAHRRAVQVLVEKLRPYRNWYLDLSNERNIGDSRHTSIEELHDLRELVRRLDVERLVTASHGGDIGVDELPSYVQEAGVDFISPHRARDASSPHQTEAKTREYLAALRSLGRVMPLHYQEPFRRGYDAGWQPSAGDFQVDLAQARAGGAAGWCFHNGDQRGAGDGEPRRSFDLRQRRLFEQLDAEERKFISRLQAGD